MRQKRSARSKIYSEISSFLKTGSYNTLQIAKATDINWETVSKALESLEAGGFIVKNENKYSLKQEFNYNPNALLGLPITKEQNDLFYQLLKRITELSVKPLNRTFLQKIIVSIIKKENLSIPYGWYLFGQCCIPKLDLSKINDYKSIDSYDDTIKQTLIEFEKYPNTDALMEAHYKEEKNDLYLTRLTINKILKRPFTEQTLELLDIQIRNIIFKFEENEITKELFEYLNGFYSTFVRLLKLPLVELENIRLEIYDAFKSVWELIGTYDLYNDTKDKFMINTKCYYEQRKNVLAELAESYILSLQDYCPPLPELNPKLKAFRASLVARSQSNP
ncbi:MAG: hypothetical protein KJ583_00795 [Nanoarchaeota archaeon]|nr:hypothetical protein [Nanoarchaeota archaeon]MBU1269355.1 hypothetical protein [Nanoarchaeota archaeon]MBU1603827.1 hypothetical protein [Nanoarchaeota archaeon]MBU2443019.1 hypothetical protein [Nanoarchaeota archaeon]